MKKNFLDRLFSFLSRYILAKYPLVNQFLEEIKENVQLIQVIMDRQPGETEKKYTPLDLSMKRTNNRLISNFNVRNNETF